MVGAVNGQLDRALAAVMAPLVDAAVERVRADLEATMRQSRPLAVDAEEAGRLLGVSETTVRRLVRAGRLPTLPHGDVGTRLLIPVRALEAYVDAAAAGAA